MPLKCIIEKIQEGLTFKRILEDLLQYIIWYSEIRSSINLCDDIPDVEDPKEEHT
jgi:hypothetical protein